MEAGTVGDDCKRVSFVEIQKKARKRVGKKAVHWTGKVVTDEDAATAATEAETKKTEEEMPVEEAAELADILD